MPMEKMWLVYALLSAVCAAFVAIFGKIGLQAVDAGIATTIRSVIMAIFLVAVMAVQGKSSMVSGVLADREALVFIMVSGIAGALSWLFYFLAIKVGDVSKVAPVDKLSVVISVLLAIVFFQEKVSFLGGMGVLLITVGVILTAIG